MKRNLLKCFIIGITTIQVGFSQSPSFKTYTNPVIPGDHSDCTLSKIGNDFYTTGSSFNPTPVIYHSTDLIHWEAIAQPVSADWIEYADTSKGGCWGGQIVYYNNKYWDFFSRANIMYFVTADKPEGPWSMPTKIIDPSQLSYGLGYDNSIFIDDDGKWYLLAKNGQANGAIVELGNDGQATGVVYDLKWLNPSPSYPYSWAEGPVMWKYNGFYYYSFARDVSGGQKVMRSKTLTADQTAWTTPVDLFNEKDPAKSSAIFSGPNHSSAAVMLNDSTSWVLHPVWSRGNGNEWYGQGRQGLVNEVHYNANEVVVDYPNNKYFTAPKLSSSGISWMVPKSDFFTSDKLNPEWSFLGQTATNLWSLTDRPGWVRLKPKNTNRPNTIIKTDAEHNYSLITRVDFDAKATSDEAGLRIMNGAQNSFVKIYCSVTASKNKAIYFSYNSTKYQSENNIGNTVWLKLVRINHNTSGYYSSDGFNWVQVGNEISISNLGKTPSDYNGWCGNRQGLYVSGSSAADFDLYIYRDAYTPILAECPANQYGTVKTTLSEGISLLDSIHNNDWSLYAGVEFGNDDYPRACDTVTFTASSATSGGKIEVWLDSIETGTKIATCDIESTGSWSVFKTFSAKTQKIKGRHDIYLRYTGNGSGRLFQLKWIKFTPAKLTFYSSSQTSNDGNALEVKFNKPIKIAAAPEGFNVTLNGNTIDSVTSITNYPNDSLSILLTLKNPITKDDIVALSYFNGNIVSKDDMELMPFNDTLVSNTWYGSKPRIVQIITNKGGDSLFITFTKKMNTPGTSASKFYLSINKSSEMSVESGVMLNEDSLKYKLKLESKVYFEDTLKLNYKGQDIKSFDDGALNSFSGMKVTNIANGKPIKLTNAILRKSGKNYLFLVIKFDKPFQKYESQKDFITLNINGKPANITTFSGAYDSLKFSFQPSVVFGDTVSLNYIGGTLISYFNGKVADIIDYPVQNIAPYVSEVESIKILDVKTYPNPIKDRVTVSANFNFNELKIYTILGSEIYTQKIQETNCLVLDQLNFNSGLYILEIRNNHSTVVSKIIVE
jgi:xylan 1,4-beta-xylosidase